MSSRRSTRHAVPDFEISTDRSRIDLDVVHGFLTTSYWGQGRTRETVERALANSICFGIYKDGAQVGFGRIVTDRAIFAYLADIFVLPGYRGRGLGKALVRAMLDHPDVRGLPAVLLRTRDAHGLYAQCGFEPAIRPDELMTLRVWSA
ncbi:MAG: GNAT family N-acetyltransferase [Acidimicrobiia bacterium]|nr:GNAT family N-acetyltransferase [Acidimicrobiia bacterium]